MNFIERAQGGENVLLVHVKSRGLPDDAMAEFTELARSAGASIVDTLQARVATPVAATYIGSGKAEEVAERVAAGGIDLVIIDALLTPVQERNLERACQCRVIDRTGLILDIFAQRARSHEGKLEVELAQLKHVATRLVRGWSHLERQRGGSIGLRGPGETQLETDRRLLAKRVDVLSERLRVVERQRAQGRRAREKAALPQVALVGYTNAGKSTLFNALTRASVYAADQLFATLDPTVRRLDRFSFGAITLADTVGFVRNLPHELVAAFRSTLTEAREADVLLHVVDAADPHAAERIAEVDAVLADIGAGEIPQIRVYNKCDLLPEWPAFPENDRAYVSAMTGQGMESLRRVIELRLGGTEIEHELTIPFAAAALRARLLHLGVGEDRQYDPAAGYRMHVRMPRTLATQLASLPGVSGQLVRRELLALDEAPESEDRPTPA